VRGTATRTVSVFSVDRTKGGGRKTRCLHQTLGLALVRLKRADAALDELETGDVSETRQCEVAYVYVSRSTRRAERRGYRAA